MSATLKALTTKKNQPAGAKPSRLSGFLVFLALTFTLYALIHISLVVTLNQWVPEGGVTGVVSALWLVSLLAMGVAKYRHNKFTNFFYRLGVTWMGIVFLLFLVLFPASMITLAVGGTLSPIMLLPVGVLVMVSVWLAHSTRIRKYDVAIGKLRDADNDLTILQMTDLHIGEIYGPRFLTPLVRRANKLKPDIIVLTGDVFDGGGKPYKGMIAPLAKLKAKHGVYYVRGNHDVYEGIAETDAQLRRCGIIVLDDAVVKVRGLHLCGMSYASDLVDPKREVLKKLAEIAGTERPRILLRHEPRDPQLASDYGYDLMLCGHTHNGQFWPLSYLVKFAYPFRIGMHRLGNMTLYIGPGIGTWGPPFRLGSRSEMTLFRLRKLPA